MPSTSLKQKKFMQAASHNPSFAKKAGIPVSVAKEFNQADKGKKFKEGGNVANLKKLFKGKDTYKEELKEGKAIKSGKLTPQQYAKGEKMEDSKKMKSDDKKMKSGGSCYAKGGVTRADGCATKGHTKGKMMAKGGSTSDDKREPYAVKNGKIYRNDEYRQKYGDGKLDMDKPLSNRRLQKDADINLRSGRWDAIERAKGKEGSGEKYKKDTAEHLSKIQEARRKASKYNESRDIVDKINPEGGSTKGTDYYGAHIPSAHETFDPDEALTPPENEDGMKKGGKVKSCDMKRGGKVKSCGMKGGGVTRGDGIASRGRTRGKFV